MKFSDIQMLVLTRALGNLCDSKLRKLVNECSGDAKIQDSAVDAYGLYLVLKKELEARGIEYSRGTFMKPIKLEGVI